MELKRIADKRNVILLLSVVFINMVVFGYKMIPDIRKFMRTAIQNKMIRHGNRCVL